MARLRLAISIVILVIGAGCVLLLDVALAITVSPVGVGAVGVLFALMALLASGVSRARWRLNLAFIASYAAALTLISLVDWNSRKPFLRALNRVQVGMTVAETRAAMTGFIEGTGFPPHPSDATEDELRVPDSLVFRHTDEGWANADWGIVRFEAGRVSEVSFSPD